MFTRSIGFAFAALITSSCGRSQPYALGVLLVEGRDSGFVPDAGLPAFDAGTPIFDAGSPDAGAFDAGIPAEDAGLFCPADGGRRVADAGLAAFARAFIDVHEVSVEGFGNAGQGLWVRVDFDDGQFMPVLEEQTASTFGCKAWDYHPRRPPTVNAGPVQIQSANDPQLFPPECEYESSGAYACVVARGTCGLVDARLGWQPLSEGGRGVIAESAALTVGSFVFGPQDRGRFLRIAGSYHLVEAHRLCDGRGSVPGDAARFAVGAGGVRDPDWLRLERAASTEQRMVAGCWRGREPLCGRSPRRFATGDQWRAPRFGSTLGVTQEPTARERD